MNESTTQISITTNTMIRFVLVLLGFFLIWYLRDLVLVVLTSIVFASFVESALPYFSRIKIGRVFAVVILYATFIFILAALFYLFAPFLITEVYNFSMMISSYIPDVGLLSYFQDEAFLGASEVVSALPEGMSLGSLLSVSRAFIENLSGGFFTALAGAFGSIFNVILIFIISFYLSIQEKGIENFLAIILPVKYEDYVIDLWARSKIKIAHWMKGQLLVGLIVAVLTYLVLSLLGIEYALLLSIIAGIMELVPYGFVVAIVPAVAFSYISGGISDALMAGGAFMIINQFESFLLSPLIVNKVVGLSPLVVILSVLIGLQLAGVWGVFLSIPVAVFFMELMNDIEKKKVKLKMQNE